MKLRRLVAEFFTQLHFGYQINLQVKIFDIFNAERAINFSIANVKMI
jgi:hypothetical protein